MADQETRNPPAALVYEDTGAMAPVVYFDIVAAYGTMHGGIEAELATRILLPRTDGTTDVKFLSSGRLRCSPTAALQLRNALDAALKMLEQPQANAVATSTMNLQSREKYLLRFVMQPTASAARFRALSIVARKRAQPVVAETEAARSAGRQKQNS